MTKANLLNQKIKVSYFLFITLLIIVTTAIVTLFATHKLTLNTFTINRNQPSSNLIVIPTPTPDPKAKPKFSVKILTSPLKVIWIDDVGQDKPILRIPLEITNISNQPYITNFRFFECKHSGVTNVEDYKISGELSFKPAILPEKTANATMELSFPRHKCGYDSAGDYGCQKYDYSNFKLTSCITKVTNSPGGWDDNSPTVIVPFP